MKVLFILGGIALSSVLAGCAVPVATGSDTVNYYYANKEGPRPAINRRVPPVVTPPPAPVPQNEPVGVARVVYFDFDRAEVRPQDRGVVAAHADFLRRTDQARVALDGHADARGGREYNAALALRRAEAVRRSLVQLGVADGKIEAVSLGEEKPASTLPSEQGFRLNRRVEFVYRQPLR